MKITRNVEYFVNFEFCEFKSNQSGWKHRYIKGLGSLQEDEYSTIINQPVYDTVTVDDAKTFEMMFGKESQLRKDYMMA